MNIAIRTGLAALALAFAAAGPASADIRINEIDSQPSDFVELYNTGNAPVDITGYTVIDGGGNTAVTFGAKTLQPGEIYAADATGLGNDDEAHLFNGATELDSFKWGPHALESYGRCPDGTGVFRQTLAPTKGAANQCGPFGDAWPGGTAIVEDPTFIGGNVSGLAYQPSGTSARGTLWAVQNSPSQLYKLVWDGTKWARATGWELGKNLSYPSGAGQPDTEGLTLAGGDANGLYASAERDGNGASRPGVLRYDVTGAGMSLKATDEWNLSADLPGLPDNEGLEAIAWVPDSVLVAKGFVDANTGAAYNPANYAGHGQGLFFVGVEQNGEIVAYALQTGAYKRIAAFPSGFRKLADLSYEADTARLFAVCDDSCDGQMALMDVGGDGKFAVTRKIERPAGMPNLNNEGFTIASHAECSGGRKPTFYADDSNTNGMALRSGTIDCAPVYTVPGTNGGSTNGGGTNNGGGGGTVVNLQPSPTPQPVVADRTAPSLKVALKVTRKTGKLTVTTTLGEKSTLAIKVTARKSAKAKARKLLTTTRADATGKQTFTLTLKKSVRAKLRKGETVTVSIVARDAAGNATTKTASAKVR
jgi:hypothetical protein